MGLMPANLKPDREMLSGKHIMVAATGQTANRIATELERRGAVVSRIEALVTCPTLDRSALDAAFDRLREYAWIIFTSANGVRYFSEYLDQRGFGEHERKNLPVCALGPATAKAAEAHGFQVQLVPAEFIAEGVLKTLGAQPGGLRALHGRRILIPRAVDARDLIPIELESLGVLVDVAPCYRSEPGELPVTERAALLERRLDMAVFTSSAAFGNFLKMMGHDAALHLLAASPVAVIGPVVAATVENYGIKPALIPRQSTVECLLGEICSFFGTECGAGPDLSN